MKQRRTRKDIKNGKTLMPLNIQFFAEPEGGGDPTAQQQNQQQTQPAAVQIDYEKLAGIVASKQTSTEDMVLKGYFKQQGLSKEEMDSAIATFKEQKAANQPDVNKIQQQAQQALAAAQQANIEKEAMFLSTELGIELKTMPYVLKMADLSSVAGEDGAINKDTLKEALNKVLEDVPALKVQIQQQQQTGFRQIGADGNQQRQNADTHTTVATKRWNRFNN